MSWFDTSGFANLAKSALKEAQKTIDKALDIKDEEQGTAAVPKVSPEEDVDGFFASWGLKTSEGNSVGESTGTSKSATSPSVETAESAISAPTTSNSLWGSFTGSFFETGAKLDIEKQSTDAPVFKQPQKSLLNLTTSQESGDSSSQGWMSTEEGTALSDEDVSAERFRQSKLVVGEPESPLETKDTQDPAKPPVSLSLAQCHTSSQHDTKIENKVNQMKLDDGITVIPLRKAISSGGNNRLSVISSSTGSPDDGCCSGESVEILGSTSEDSMSPDTACHVRHRLGEQSSPESVGVLGGSSSDVTSPSSVEVLGWSEANSPCSPCAPRPNLLFPGQLRSQGSLVPSRSSNLLSPSNPVDKISPESVEIIGEDESEASLADDSSTSASSTTTTTVMEPKTLLHQEDRLNSSTHVRSMLAEAMEEQSSQSSDQSITNNTCREHSPISSESRSEVLKQESEQTSGQTSGDELETTTSSDIEIISSPNGDGSSTHSRHSPTKLLGQAGRVNLELLSGSSGSPDSTCSGTRRPVDHLATNDELLKKLSDMSALLESRETKLIELSRSNVELQEHNSHLQRQFEAGLQSQAANSQDVNHITEEFTQRLSSLERRFQQAIRDKDNLKKQLDLAKQEASSRMAASQLESLLTEKDEEIRELREEGEKLSKQQLQLSTLIKKLRAKEKEQETAAKTNKQQLIDLSQETERLKRSLSAKEEVERSQIEAVNRLTAQVKRQDRELSVLQEQLNEAQAVHDKLQASLDAANKEVTELRSTQLSSELAQRQVLSARLEEQQAEAEAERQSHLAELEQLRSELAGVSESSSRREETMRKEQAAMLRRLTVAEARADELAHCTTDATRPLLRQLEALQASATSQQFAAERSERLLSDKLAETQARLASMTEQERVSREHRATASTQLNNLQAELTTLTASVKQLQSQNQILTEEKDRVVSAMETLQSSTSEELTSLRREVTSLREQLSIQQAATEAERRHCAALQQELQLQQQTAQEHRQQEANNLTVSLHLPSPSVALQTPPRSSSSPASLAESLLGSSWMQDDPFLDTPPILGLAHEHSPGPTSALLEGLQSQLKRREGEASLLRSETRKLELQRAELTRQVAALTARADSQSTELERLAELERKYDALLQMYGEQLEANQELKLDLDDVKEMYRTQIETLLANQSQSPQ